MGAPARAPVASGSMSRPPLSARLVTVLFRLGFGWLIGRRWLLLVTSTGTGSDHRTTLLRYRKQEGAVWVAATPGPWLDDLANRPVATANAAPGPLAVAARRRNGDVVLERTGRQSPPVIVPDLNWVLPAVAAALWVISRLLRR